MSSSGQSPSGANNKRRLVLVGGGHAHVQVIKALNYASRPKNIHVTLIDLSITPSYSGMVPGAVAGLYRPEETLLELKPLAKWGCIDFVHDRVVDIDVNEKRIKLAGEHQQDRQEIPFDAVSIDIGSASRGLTEVPGAQENTIPTRPISDLVKRMEMETKMLKEKQTRQDEPQNVRVVVVGGGAAGIELSMGTWGRWTPIVGSDNIQVTLLDAGDELVPNESNANREALKKCLQERGISVLHSVKVERVEKDCLVLQSGERIAFTHCLWATGAASHPLATCLQQHGLSTTEHGWIRVNQYLQSLSHPCVFAAGDCSSIEIPGGRSPPKAGVFAVRAGPILIENLTRYLEHHDGHQSSPTLKPYVPQQDFLKLLVCGDGKGLGFRFGIPIYGKWVFQLKDAIDRSFVDLFKEENLPELKEGEPYDTSQYDAARERPPPMDPSKAAALLQRSDDDVDFHDAWNVLRDMAQDDEYQSAVLKHIPAYGSEKETTMA